MKNLFRTLFVLAVLACLLALGIYYPLAAPKEASFSESENRNLAAFPDVKASLMKSSLDSDIETYLLDRFPGRDSLVSLSQKLKDRLSFASYEEYLQTAQEQKDPTADDDIDDALGELIGQLTVTPKATATPTNTPTETPSPTPEPTLPPEITATPTPSLTPPPSPTPAENPPIVAKEPADVKQFAATLRNYMSVDGVETAFGTYPRDNVQAFISVLNKYAETLPENGKLMYVIAPHSTYVNRFKNTSQNGYMKSESVAMINALSNDNVYAFDAYEILSEHIKQGEYVSFRADHHWTAYGAYLVCSQMLLRAGKIPCDFQSDLTHTFESNFLGTIYRDHPSEDLKKQADTLELVEPLFPHELRKITGKDTYKVIPFLNMNAPSNDRYAVYLGGIGGPWIYVESDNGQTENALVIMDSFGLSAFPTLMQSYKQVHYYDPSYYDYNTVGYTVSEMIEKYNITDIYVILADFHTYKSSYIIKNANSQY